MNLRASVGRAGHGTDSTPYLRSHAQMLSGCETRSNISPIQKAGVATRTIRSRASTDTIRRLSWPLLSLPPEKLHSLPMIL
jgi:hypothetical protein